MDKFFNFVFQVTRRYWRLAILLLAGIVLFCAFAASSIKLEENVFDLFPQDEGMREVSEMISDLSVSNRLIFNLYFDENMAADADSLIAVADDFAGGLGAEIPAYIDSLVLTIPDSRVEALYSFYLAQLPFYLTEADYIEMEKRISPDGIDHAIEKCYRSLLSPLGMVTKRTMAADPLGLVSFPLSRARDFQIEANFDIYRNHLLTKDRRHLVFFLELTYPPNRTDKNRMLIEQLDLAIETYLNSRSDLNIEYFGGAAVSVANAVRVERDIYITVSLALIILFCFISIFYRNVSTFFLVLLPAVFGGLVGTAFLVLLRDSVSVISLATGSVLLGITIDYSLHLLTHFKEEQNFKNLFAAIAQPTIIAALTTACAFFSLLFVGSRAMQDLGIFAGISVLASALFALVVLPHLALATGAKSQSDHRLNAVEKAVFSLARYPFHRKKWAIGVFALLCIASTFMWGSYRFESNMLSLNYMPENLEMSQANLNAISTLSANTVYVATKGTNFQEALSNQSALAARIDSLQSDGKMLSYFGANSLIPSPMLQAERLERWKDFWRRHPADSVHARIEAKASTLGFGAGVFDQFAASMKRSYEPISQASATELLSIFGEDLLLENRDGSQALLTIIKAKNSEKPVILEQLTGIPDVLILDKAFLVSRLADLLSDDFNKLVQLSLLFVFLIILISYGRIELALMAYLPILLSWFWVLGMMGLFQLSFNIVNIIICTFIFGLGIDYSVFSLRGMLEHYSYGRAKEAVYKKSIILSAFTTLVGIGVLAFAQHPALKSIALLAIIGICSVLFITFTMQPLLFHWIIGKRKEKRLIPYTFSSLILSAVAFIYFLIGCIFLFALRLILGMPLGKVEGRKYLFHVVLMYFCRSEIYLMANVKKVIIDRAHADFSKPAVIISNHHSFIDILIVLMFHPKVVIVTNDWVYHSPFFGSAVRFGDFIPSAQGLENQTERIQDLIDCGYSIAVFPEGTRQKGFELGRFHKGAFALAESFGLDIQPIVLHGTNMAMPKGDDFYLKSARISVQFLKRIPLSDAQFGVAYAERCKLISRHHKAAYAELRQQLETPRYFREIIIKNFIYKSPIVEWYLRIKIRFEDYYQLFHQLIPREASIYDLGCGYGFMSYGLALASAKRQITGVDYDEEKINLAQECPVKPHNLNFRQGDVANITLPNSDVFLISDVLHYLTEDEQKNVLENALAKLNPDGKIIIRDGDSSQAKRHKGTRITEFFSTNIGFNKTRNRLNYISGEMIAKFAATNALRVEIIDETKRTSNLVFVLTRK